MLVVVKLKVPSLEAPTKIAIFIVFFLKLLFRTIHAIEVVVCLNNFSSGFAEDIFDVFLLKLCAI